MLVTAHGINGQYGDCLRACVSSLFECNPEYVPHFSHDGSDEYISRLNHWLEDYNCWFIEMNIDGSRGAFDQWLSKIPGEEPLFMVGVPSKIHKCVGHWCIAKFTDNKFTIIHDPSPCRQAMNYTDKDIESVGLFIQKHQQDLIL